jgi:hypothetical protein
MGNKNGKGDVIGGQVSKRYPIGRLFIKYKKSSVLRKSATAFIIHYNNMDIIITALHSFGKYNKSSELKGKIQFVQIKIFGDNLILANSKSLHISGGGNIGNTSTNDTVNDIVAFKADLNSKLFHTPKSIYKKLILSNDLVKIGDKVWICSQELKSKNKSYSKFGGTIIEINDKKFRNYIIDMDDPNIDLMSFSGSPIVNNKFEVVSILIGGEKYKKKNKDDKDDIDGLYVNSMPLNLVKLHLQSL